MKKIVILLGLTLLTNLYSQRFCSSFGGPGAEYGYDILATNDGGFVVAGSTDSYGAGGIDFYIVKFDASGTAQWTRTVGGASNEIAYGISVAENGDYLVAGESNTLGTGGEVYIARLSSTGSLLWTRSIGGTGYDFAKEITATSDNGCAIVGNTDSYGQGGSDVYVAKLDSTGVVEWDFTTGTLNPEGGYGITATSDGNLVMVGRCFPLGFGGAQIFVTKLTMAGAVVWSKYFSSHDDTDFLLPGDIVESGGGYIITGYSDTTGALGSKNNFLTKVSTSGAHIWTQVIGITGDDFGYGLETTNDGGFILSGKYYSGTTKAVSIKTDANGIPEWYTRSTFAGNNYSYGAVQLNNGTYVSAGNTDADGSDIFLVQFDSTGFSCCGSSVAFSNGSLVNTIGNYGIVASGSVVDTGGVASSGGTGNILCSSPTGIENNGGDDLIKLYPNPAKSEITIEGLEGYDSVSIMNSLGEMLGEISIKANEMKLQLNSFTKGVYYINLKSKDKLVTKKLVIE